MNAATKPSTSSCPRSDKAASCSPAAQPSVRAASAAATASGSGAPGRAPPGAAATCCSSAAASPGVNRSSAARSSVSCPRARSPRQGQWRVAAAGQRQLQPRRPVLEQEPERLVYQLRADHVIVIQDQQQRLICVRLAGYLVDQGRHQRLERRWRGGPEQRAHPLADPRPHPVQRGDRMPPEPGRVVVAGIQRQPGHWMPTAPDPLGQQDGLAVPGRRGEQDKPSSSGPRRAAAPAADAAPDLAATRARSAWWPAGHRAPTLRPRRPTHPSVTCTIGASSDLASLLEPHRNPEPPGLNSGN